MLPAFNANMLPGEEVDALLGNLAPFVRALRGELGWSTIGVELRLGRTLIRQCQRSAAHLDRLRAGLDALGVAVTSINAFPLLPFQTQARKQQVYEPDWTRMERQDLTTAAIAIASRLIDTDPVTISTLPGSYKPWGSRANDAKRIAAAWGRWAAAAWQHRTACGRQVVLCPEPEPWCSIENSRELADFWRGPLATVGLAAASALIGDRDQAAEALRAHLGYCHDTCHFSMALEDQAQAVERAVAAGARPWKCQYAAAALVQAPQQNQQGLEDLQALDEPRFLHQTLLASRSGSQWRLPDLGDLPMGLTHLPTADQVRCHFHLPVFWPSRQRGLSTTIAESEAGLRACLQHGCRSVAVETYTWSVLAAEDRDPVLGTARELAHLQDLLKRFSEL